jgi:hypothetical protein
MIEANSNHWQVVAGSLAGKREVDEQTFASLAVLGERLEKLKGLDNAFSGVKLSPAVRKLQENATAVAVG